jgi:hypothetical protein
MLFPNSNVSSALFVSFTIIYILVIAVTLLAVVASLAAVSLAAVSIAAVSLATVSIAAVLLAASLASALLAAALLAAALLTAANPFSKKSTYDVGAFSLLLSYYTENSLNFNPLVIPDKPSRYPEQARHMLQPVQ